MGSYTYVSGHLTFDPPATWAEARPILEREPVWTGENFPYEIRASDMRIACGDVILEYTEDEETAADGAITLRRTITRVLPGYEESSTYRDLNASMRQIGRDFGTAPDGTTRTFRGHLQTEFKDEFHMTRLFLRSGELIEHQAAIDWPPAPA